MSFKFTKMEGAGNDFIVIDATKNPFSLRPSLIKRLSDRHFGVGFDQLLVVEKSQRNDVDFAYRIYNSDGGEVNQCGNGARCFAKFVYEKKLTTKTEIVVETRSGLIKPKLENDGEVSVDMGVPLFSPKDIPLNVDQQQNTYRLTLKDRAMEFGSVSMGNPHAIFFTENLENIPVAEWGPLLENHPTFPERANISFVQVSSRNQLKMRVWERGAGETLACGTAACAAVVFGIKEDLLDRVCAVSLPGGVLNVSWSGDDQSVFLKGPATTVFEGTIDSRCIENE